MNAGIYVFKTVQGLDYVGQSGNIAVRLLQHIARGKVTVTEALAAERFAVVGGKLEREIAEQLKIDDLRKIGMKLENIVNPIGPKRFHVMPDQPYFR